MQEQDERAILEDIIRDVDKLIGETRGQRKEAKSLDKEIEEAFEAKELTDFSYAVKKEQMRRHNQNIDYCLRSLDRQKKIALTKIRELE